MCARARVCVYVVPIGNSLNKPCYTDFLSFLSRVSLLPPLYSILVFFVPLSSPRLFSSPPSLARYAQQLQAKLEGKPFEGGDVTEGKAMLESAKAEKKKGPPAGNTAAAPERSSSGSGSSSASSVVSSSASRGSLSSPESSSSGSGSSAASSVVSSSASRGSLSSSSSVSSSSSSGSVSTSGSGSGSG